jgi:hypothetical protein
MKSTSAADPTNHNNKPHIIIQDNGKGSCVLIEVAVTGDRNKVSEESI